MGEPPADIQNPHRHHVVREAAPSNWSSQNQKLITDAQNILNEVGLNDFNSNELNFIWATNGAGNHSVQTARVTLETLKPARGNLGAVLDVLEELKSKYIGGVFRP
jgi:hypothetical protein